MYSYTFPFDLGLPHEGSRLLTTCQCTSDKSCEHRAGLGQLDHPYKYSTLPRQSAALPCNVKNELEQGCSLLSPCCKLSFHWLKSIIKDVCALNIKHNMTHAVWSKITCILGTANILGKQYYRGNFMEKRLDRRQILRWFKRKYGLKLEIFRSF